MDEGVASDDERVATLQQTLSKIKQQYYEPGLLTETVRIFRRRHGLDDVNIKKVVEETRVADLLDINDGLIGLDLIEGSEFRIKSCKTDRRYVGLVSRAQWDRLGAVLKKFDDGSEVWSEDARWPFDYGSEGVEVLISSLEDDLKAQLARVETRREAQNAPKSESPAGLDVAADEGDVAPSPKIEAPEKQVRGKKRKRSDSKAPPPAEANSPDLEGKLGSSRKRRKRHRKQSQSLPSYSTPSTSRRSSNTQQAKGAALTKRARKRANAKRRSLSQAGAGTPSTQLVLEQSPKSAESRDLTMPAPSAKLEKSKGKKKKKQSMRTEECQGSDGRSSSNVPFEMTTANRSPDLSAVSPVNASQGPEIPETDGESEVSLGGQANLSETVKARYDEQRRDSSERYHKTSSNSLAARLDSALENEQVYATATLVDHPGKHPRELTSSPSQRRRPLSDSSDLLEDDHDEGPKSETSQIAPAGVTSVPVDTEIPTIKRTNLKNNGDERSSKLDQAHMSTAVEGIADPIPSAGTSRSRSAPADTDVSTDTSHPEQYSLPTPQKSPLRAKAKRKSTGTKSSFFNTSPGLKRSKSAPFHGDAFFSLSRKKQKVAGVSVITMPALTAKSFGLIQEQYTHEPLHLLIATNLLNKTTGRAAIPALWRLIEKFPTADALAKAPADDVLEIIGFLGLQHDRTSRLIELGKMWSIDSPTRERRHRTLHYPKRDDGDDIRPGEVAGPEETDPRRGAWEIAHLPGAGSYALDSWRIFCRDELRGLAEDYNGKGARPTSLGRIQRKGGAEAPIKESDLEVPFEPEWKRVMPRDKELKAFLRWMWLKDDFDWNPETGERKRASLALLERVNRGAEEVEVTGSTGLVGTVYASRNTDGDQGTLKEAAPETVHASLDLVEHISSSEKENQPPGDRETVAQAPQPKRRSSVLTSLDDSEDQAASGQEVKAAEGHDASDAKKGSRRTHEKCDDTREKARRRRSPSNSSASGSEDGDGNSVKQSRMSSRGVTKIASTIEDKSHSVGSNQTRGKHAAAADLNNNGDSGVETGSKLQQDPVRSASPSAKAGVGKHNGSVHAAAARPAAKPVSDDEDHRTKPLGRVRSKPPQAIPKLISSRSERSCSTNSSRSRETKSPSKGRGSSTSKQQGLPESSHLPSEKAPSTPSIHSAPNERDSIFSISRKSSESPSPLPRKRSLPPSRIATGLAGYGSDRSDSPASDAYETAHSHTSDVEPERIEASYRRRTGHTSVSQTPKPGRSQTEALSANLLRPALERKPLQTPARGAHPTETQLTDPPLSTSTNAPTTVTSKSSVFVCPPPLSKGWSAWSRKVSKSLCDDEIVEVSQPPLMNVAGRDGTLEIGGRPNMSEEAVRGVAEAKALGWKAVMEAEIAQEPQSDVFARDASRDGEKSARASSAGQVNEPNAPATSNLPDWSTKQTPLPPAQHQPQQPQSHTAQPPSKDNYPTPKFKPINTSNDLQGLNSNMLNPNPPYKLTAPLKNGAGLNPQRAVCSPAVNGIIGRAGSTHEGDGASATNSVKGSAEVGKPGTLQRPRGFKQRDIAGMLPSERVAVSSEKGDGLTTHGGGSQVNGKGDSGGSVADLWLNRPGSSKLGASARGVDAETRGNELMEKGAKGDVVVIDD